jgi:hypothetical protein
VAGGLLYKTYEARIAVRRLPAALILVEMFTVPFLSAQTTEAPSTYHNIPRPRLSLANVQSRPPKTKSRWDRFDAEFGIQNQRTTAVTEPIARVKYGADVVLFSLDALVNTIEDAMELRYSHGRIRRAAAAHNDPDDGLTRLTGPLTLEDARLKFDLELTSGKPYLGVRLVIPMN